MIDRFIRKHCIKAMQNLFQTKPKIWTCRVFNKDKKEHEQVCRFAPICRSQQGSIAFPAVDIYAEVTHA